MIINRPGATFTYEDVVYTIGEKVFANGTSDYHGLVGHIYEIRDGEDKETENDGQDFHLTLRFLPMISKGLNNTFLTFMGQKSRLKTLLSIW